LYGEPGDYEVGYSHKILPNGLRNGCGTEPSILRRNTVKGSPGRYSDYNRDLWVLCIQSDVSIYYHEMPKLRWFKSENISLALFNFISLVGISPSGCQVLNLW
jgi:hypothetical protein